MKEECVIEELKKLRNYLEKNNIDYGFFHSPDGKVESISLSIRISSLPCPIFEYKLAEKIAERHKVKCYVDCDNWAEDRSEVELRYSIRYGIICQKEEEIKNTVRKLVEAKNDVEKALERASRWFLKNLTK